MRLSVQRSIICMVVLLVGSIERVVARPADGLEPTPVAIDAKVSAVTVYRGRAAVTRSASVDLAPGVYDLRITNLPEAVLPESLQARAQGAVNVVGVDFAQEQVTTPPVQFAELDEKIESLQRQLKEIAEQRDLIKSQEAYLDAISSKAASDASRDAGTPALDLDAIAKQLTYWEEQRTRFITARRELDIRHADLEKQLKAAQANRAALAGSSTVSRTAIISVVVTESGPVNLQLVYLVANATWEPQYSVRAALDGSTAQIEYDAMLTQRTGEHWENVSLTLSTAQPTLSANPPTLDPWYVDVIRPLDKSAPGTVSASAPPRPMELRAKAVDGVELGEHLRGLAADAEVVGGGPSVTYHIPRGVTVPSNIERQQRTRIATINGNPQFVHVATPMLTDAVYIRGDLVNSSPYQLLPGKASIFVGQDFVGPTTLESIAPNGEIKLHFGIDQSVKATRQLVTKTTENTGLLGGGRRTSYDYRILIDNGTGKPITLELWDRYPVSRAGEIQIDLVGMSHPLATDAKYEAEQRSQGLLKWALSIPANASGKNAAAVTYGVRINRGKDVNMTGLPE